MIGSNRTDQKATRPIGKRLWIILSLAAMFLLGVPIWWKSTEIYRAELPYDYIEAVSESQVYLTPFGIKIDLFLPECAHNVARYAHELQHQIETNKNNNHSPYQVNYSVTGSSTTFTTRGHNATAICEQVEAFFPSNSNGEYGFIISTSPVKDLSAILCTSRYVVVFTENFSDSIPLKDISFIPTVSRLITDKIVTSAVEKAGKSLVTNPGFKFSFNLVQDSTGWDVPIVWDFESIYNRYLKKMLTVLEQTAEITVDSQIKHYVTLQLTPHIHENQFYYFESAQVPHILPHPNEWNSDFIATTQPTLHFTMFLTPRQFHPLHLLAEHERGFTIYEKFGIQQTGCTVVVNRVDGGKKQQLEEYDIQRTMGFFVAQIRELFGLDSFDYLQTDPITQKNTQFVVPSTSGIADWEADRLIRERTYDNLLAASDNLLSLSDMVRKLTNMEIQDHIQSTVLSSLDAISTAHKEIQAGNFGEAQKASTFAMVKAKEAFFDPTMVSRLYFPDEHKFAVYTPLFLPISIPLFLKLTSELKKFFLEKKSKKESKEPTLKQLEKFEKRVAVVTGSLPVSSIPVLRSHSVPAIVKEL